MACTSPITVWRSRRKNKNGNYGIAFDDYFGEPGTQFQIECGKCTGCRDKHAASWTHRLIQESKFHLKMCFITLTYAPAYLPEHNTLVKRDLQLFFKAVRNHYRDDLDEDGNPIRFRYFAVGEYGEKGNRAHYHIIMFGLDFVDDRRPAGIGAAGDKMYRSATLDVLWGKGMVRVGSVTPNSCGYVAQYAFKKVKGNEAGDFYRWVDEFTGETGEREREFALMSTHPGIGRLHYDRYGDQMYQRGSIIIAGKEKPISRYFDRCLMRDDPLRMESIKTGRFEDAQLRKAENTPERLAVKEVIYKARHAERERKNL